MSFIGFSVVWLCTVLMFCCLFCFVFCSAVLCFVKCLYLSDFVSFCWVAYVLSLSFRRFVVVAYDQAVCSFVSLN